MTKIATMSSLPMLNEAKKRENQRGEMQELFFFFEIFFREKTSL